MEYFDEMLSLEGIDMVSSGRGDISQSLGVPGHTDDPRIDEMESALIKKSHEYGKVPVMLTSSKAKVDDYIKQGLRMITVGKDEALLFTAMKDCVKKMRG
jgi:4-hydroxy-2-oxoheptanedioate aldolase